MSFKYENFIQNGVNKRPGIPSIYAYSGIEPLESVLEPGYFNDSRLELEPGDIVNCYLSDGFFPIEIISNGDGTYTGQIAGATKDRARNIFVSNGGQDSNSGFTDQKAKRTLQAAIDAALDLEPSLQSPVWLGETGATRYGALTIEQADFTQPDNTRLNLQDSSITGTLKLGENAYARLASILTTGLGGETAIDSNSKDRCSPILFGVILNGLGDIGHHISGDSLDNFADIGQISCNADNCLLVKYDSTGTPRRLQYNELNIGSPELYLSNPNNCTIIEYNSTNTKSLALDVSSMTNDGSGTGNTGIKMIQGHLHVRSSEIGLDNQTAVDQSDGELDISCSDMRGAVNISGGETTINTQRLTGDINQSGGISSFDILDHDGSINISSSARCTIDIDDLDGDINHTANNIIAINVLSMAGNVVLNGAASTTSLHGITGSVEIQSGIHGISSHAIIGNLTLEAGIGSLNIDNVFGNVSIETGSITRCDIITVEGDLTIEAGSVFNGIIAEVTGNITIDASADINGVINGVKYATWQDGQQLAVSGNRDGTIPNSYSAQTAHLRFPIDTTTDSITDANGDSITCKYLQSNNNSRTVSFRVVDADTSTVYWEASNTDTTAEPKTFNIDLVNDLVNPLPTNQPVNLLVQAEKTGSGISDAGTTVIFTRSP